MRTDQARVTVAQQSLPPAGEQASALVTTATSQPALRTGFAMLGLASLLELPKCERADRMMALGGAATAGWYLVRSGRRR